MTEPTRRLYTRQGCQIPAKVLSLPSKETISGELLNIGLGGAFLRAPGVLEKEARLTFSYAGTEFAMDAYVVRRIAPSPKDPRNYYYGLEFHPHPKLGKTILTLLDKLTKG